MKLFALLSKKEKIQIFFVLLFLVITAFFSFLPIIFMERYINSVVKGMSVILILGGGYLVIQLINAGFRSFTDYIISKQQILIASNLQKKLFDTYVKMDYDEIIDIDFSDVTNALLEDVSIIADKYLLPLTNTVNSLVTFIVGIIYIIRINNVLALIIVPLGIITAVLNWLSEKKYIENAIEKKDLSISLWKSFSEIFKGIIPIRIYNRENDYKQIIEKKRERYKYISNKQNFLEKINAFAASFLFMFSIGVILIVAGLLTANNKMSIGGMVAVLMYNHMITDPLIALIETKKMSIEVKTSINRLNSFLNGIKVNKLKETGACDKLVIKNLYFNYKNNKTNNFILQNINLTLHNDEKIAIFGKSGCGKTTLIKLIAGFYNSYTGEISYYLNNQKNNYLPSISYLYQNSYLFDDSIINNIKLSKPNACKTEIDNIIKICLLDEVIRKYKDFNIGEGGESLSGGEKTRVRLAITILKSDASIYIFDELSTSLDSKTFEKIMFNLSQYLTDKMCIFIEHNKLIKQFVDKVYTLSNGYLSLDDKLNV